MSRRDYYHDPNAPAANSIVPAVTVVVTNSDHILLQHRVDNDLWALPGGAIDIGETPTQAATRETREETGIAIDVTGLVGVYSDPGHVIAYDNGEIRQQFSICLAARATGGQLRSQPTETKHVAWVPIDDLNDLPMHPAQRIRIRHGLAWKPGIAAHID
jgi:ADP-ribose pyrophosphatase YjhB (NUDIX family)